VTGVRRKRGRIGSERSQASRSHNTNVGTSANEAEVTLTDHRLHHHPAIDPALSVALVVRNEEDDEPGTGWQGISLITRAGKAPAAVHGSARRT